MVVLQDVGGWYGCLQKHYKLYGITKLWHSVNVTVCVIYRNKKKAGGKKIDVCTTFMLNTKGKTAFMWNVHTR